MNARVRGTGLMKKLALMLSLAGLLLTGSASAGVFTKPEMDEVSCAALKMQLFYYYLTPDRDKSIQNYTLTCKGTKLQLVMPAWLNTAVPEMANRKVWRDPQEGELSEASVWQTPVSILYEFMELTKKTFPPEQGGAGIQPALLVKEYADIRIRFQMAMDRLYRARTRDVTMFDSMDGRGRTVMAQFSLILDEMESIADAISSTNSQRYAAAVTASAALSEDAFRTLFLPPRVYEPPPQESQTEKVVNTALTILGIILIFLAVQAYFALNDEKTNALMGSYAQKVATFTEAFSRQFISINVKYLVLGPTILLALLGLFTGSILAFLVLSAVGFFVGLRTPAFVLDAMKQARGRKIDGQLMDGLILLANCLRSGLDIVQGFEMVSKDLLPPISDEFGLVIKNYQLGMTFEKALGVMEERVASKMLSYMIRAIVLQRQMGGNLTKVFERIVVDIREESKLDEKTKAMTAQQKIQSIVVGIMPWVMVGVMFMFQPDQMISFYGSPLGMGVFIFCAVWIGIGMKVVSSLGKIRV